MPLMHSWECSSCSTNDPFFVEFSTQNLTNSVVNVNPPYQYASATAWLEMKLRVRNEQGEQDVTSLYALVPGNDERQVGAEVCRNELFFHLCTAGDKGFRFKNSLRFGKKTQVSL